MSHHEHHEKKKLKRLQQFLHNRRTLHINQQVETLEKSRDLDREREEEIRNASAAASRAAAKASPDGKSGNRQLDLIREKNTHRQRLAQDRWNRFAGTESGGGRGL